jgi:hypothetical protein
MSENIRRIAIAGGAGSGKTTLAERIARQTGWLVHDLDGVLLSRSATLANGDSSSLLDILLQDPIGLATGDAWIADGAYSWATPLYERAEVVVWMDVPWRIASWRILKRHVVAEAARSNRFPGWRRLYRFWSYSGRFYANVNPDGENEFGTPRTRRYLADLLRRYEHKLIVCRSREDVERLLVLLPRT